MCRKSQAMMLFACVARNSRQVGPVRRGCGTDAGRVQDVPDGGCGDGVAEPREFAVNPAVSPSAVLGGKSHDELANRGGCGRAARFRASGCVVPFPGDECAVPGQQGRRCDGKDRRPPVGRITNVRQMGQDDHGFVGVRITSPLPACHIHAGPVHMPVRAVVEPTTVVPGSKTSTGFSRAPAIHHAMSTLAGLHPSGEWAADEGAKK
jgi:hypothetical protein